MPNFCIACECMCEKKLCNVCYRTWQESNLPYGYWLITLPPVHSVMKDIAVKEGKASSRLQQGIMSIVFPPRPYDMINAQRNCATAIGDNPQSLANSVDRQLWYTGYK